MPVHRGVTISLQSQYDAVTIPEYLSTASNSINFHNNSISSLDLASNSGSQLQRLPAHHSRTVEITIPILPSSQFWVSYSCRAPQARAPGWNDVRFYYFKLYIAGECALSWGVGEQEEWTGSTMFGLFDAGTDFEGKKMIEKRGFFFPHKDQKLSERAGFEIRVFRAKARKREAPKYESFGSLWIGHDGLELKMIGIKRRGERQRAYTYALVDAKDEPYVTFKYSFRTDDEIRQLNDRLSGESGVEQSADFSSHLAQENIIGSPTTSSLNAQPALTAMPPLVDGIGYVRRLSLPPRKPLAATTTQAEPSSPVKKDIVHSTGSRCARSIEQYDPELRTHQAGAHATPPRTPSPVDGYLDRRMIPGTPPSQRKAVTSGLLRGVVASALRRKEMKHR